MDGVVAGVGDEVDVGGGEFAADEADDVLGGAVGVGELEVGGAEVVEGLAEESFVGDDGDGMGEFGDLGGGLAVGIEGRGVSDGDDLSTSLGEGVDLAEGLDWDTVGGGEDEDLVVEAEAVDGVGVDEVEVVAGGEDSGDEAGGDKVGHLSGDGDLAGSEVGPGVVGGEEDSDLVGGLALAEEEADTLDVAGDLGHDGVPGVGVVEDGSGVEGPAGVSGLELGGGWGVGPAVEDEEVFAGEEVDVGLGFHVEGGGAEDGGMEPGEGLTGGDVVAEEVVGRGGPAECGKLAPLWTLSFREGDQALTCKANSWFTICLRAKLGVMREGPVIDLSQVVFVDQFGEGSAPVVPDGLCGRCASGGEFGEVGEQVVAAALAEFGGEVGGPVGSVGFEGVGEDGVGRGGSEGFDEWGAYGLEVMGDGLVAEGVEDPAFGTDGGALDDLMGVAGDEDEGDAGLGVGGDG